MSSRAAVIGLIVTALLVGLSASGSVAMAASDAPTVQTTQYEESIETQSGLNVSLVPADQTVDAGTTTTYDIVVTGATDGIDAYELTMDLSNVSVGTFTDYEHEQAPGADGTEIRENGSQLYVEAAMLGNPIAGAETITLGTVTISGDTEGMTTLMPRDAQISTGGTSYDIDTVSDGTLTVEGEITDPELALSLAEPTIEEGQTTELSVAATDIENGVSEFTVTLDPDTADVVNLSNVSVAGDESPVVTEGENGSVQIEAEPDRGNGDLTLATLAVTGTAPGESEINISEVTVVDQDGSAYDPRSVTGTAITVEGVGDSIDIDLRPTDDEVPVASSAAVDVVVDGPGAGVSAFELNVTLENGTTSRITEYEYNKQPDFDNTQLDNDGNFVQLSAGMGGNTYAPADEVVIATIVIESDAPGTVQVTADEANIRVDDTDGNTYETGAVSDGTFDVVAGPPPVVGDNAPQDLDGDGNYEDVDGDGDFTVFDVQTLYQNLQADPVQNNPNAFNFDGDENPDDVTVFDIQALFKQLEEQN